MEVRRIRIISITLIMTLLLTGCAKSKSGGGKDERNNFLDIRTKYITDDNLSLTADMTADYGDRVYEYKLSYAGNGESGIINVSEPAIISGLAAVYDKGEVTLQYDGAVLDTGALIGGSLSPLQAFPMLIEAWKTGYVSDCWNESRNGVKCTAAEIIISEGEENNVLCRIWFDGEHYNPVYSEISVNGFTVLYCEFIT